jgi:hypothetical protein
MGRMMALGRRSLGSRLTFSLMLFTSRQLLAADAAPGADVTIPPLAGASVPPLALQPLSRAPQRSDPDAPIQPVPHPSPVLSTSAARTGEGEFVAAEIVVASLVMTGLGVGGHFALAYQPKYETIPMSTTASTSLNLTGIVALLAAPAIAGRLVCGIGRLSASYEGSCGWSIGLAYIGISAAGFAALATTGKQPTNCDECAIPGPSVVAVLVAYIVGVATGAVVGWNLSKVRKDESLALQPIFRAGPPPAALADWFDPTLRSSVRRTGDAMSVQVPLIAFAF